MKPQDSRKVRLELQVKYKKLDGVLIVTDEIHNLKDVDGAAQILRAFSTTLDENRQGKTSFLVIGYADGIEHFFADDPSARRHFDMIHLSVMPRKDALDKNIDVVGGYPHSIQVIGHHLVEVDIDRSCIHKPFSAHFQSFNLFFININPKHPGAYS